MISSDEMNAHIATVSNAPLTTKGREYSTRVPCAFQGESGLVVLDQLRPVDRLRLVKRPGFVDAAVADAVLEGLSERLAK